MDRRRFYQGLLTVALVAFLAVLALKFRPKVDSPRPVALPGAGSGVSGTLTTTGFRYVQEEAGKTAFVLTAQKVTERGGESRDLEGPRLTLPGTSGETVLSGAQGLFDPTTKTLRVFGGGRLLRPDGWTALSEGFRMTPEGELVAEAEVTLSRRELQGTADLMRYDRETEKAYLEGHVRFQDTAGRRASCTRLMLDLAAHTGALSGPVAIETPQGRVDAPQGQIVLGPDNAVQEVHLGSPATGEGPAGRFRTDRLVLTAGPGGALERLSLEGAVRAEAATGEILETGRIALAPGPADRWAWSAPGALTVSKSGDRMEAPSGTGAAGGGRPFLAQLPGPVRGDGPSGRWSARRASVEGPVRTLEGEVEASRPGETLTADRVVIRADGSQEAFGHARGTRATKGAPQLRFRADHALAAPSGYPVALDGNVGVARELLTLVSPAATVKGPALAEATGGVLVRNTGPRGEETLRARKVVYDGDAALVTATGEARGDSQGYTLKAAEVRAFLDAAGNPERYEAQGAAELDGPARAASGDHLTWEPARQAGTAESQDGRAVVVQKNPYRRAEGPKVAFLGDAVTVSGATAGRRGYLESAPPAPRRPDGR